MVSRRQMSYSSCHTTWNGHVTGFLGLFTHKKKKKNDNLTWWDFSPAQFLQNAISMAFPWPLLEIKKNKQSFILKDPQTDSLKQINSNQFKRVIHSQIRHADFLEKEEQFVWNIQGAGAPNPRNYIIVHHTIRLTSALKNAAVVISHIKVTTS